MKTIVGLFDNFSEAEATVRDLERAGYDRSDISMVANESSRGGARTTTTTSSRSDDGGGAAEGAGTGAVVGGVTGGVAGLIASLAGLAIPGIGPVLAAGPLVAALTGAGVGAVAGGLIGALTSAGVPEEHARYYEEGVRRGGTLVTVAASDADADEVMDIMNRHNPVDIEERASVWRETGAGTAATARTGQTTTGAVTGSNRAVAETQSRTAEGQEAIPVVEEELQVGKREVERGGIRVYTRMEERPVVQKQARVVEEVVVGKEATERTETVRDTVRHTDVKVEQVGAEAGSGFEAYETDYRTNFQQSFPGGEYTYDQVKPVYQYGHTLASQHRGADWNTVEGPARQRWEERNPGTWDKFKNAARYAWERGRDKVS